MEVDDIEEYETEENASIAVKVWRCLGKVCIDWFNILYSTSFGGQTKYCKIGGKTL